MVQFSLLILRTWFRLFLKLCYVLCCLWHIKANTACGLFLSVIHRAPCSTPWYITSLPDKQTHYSSALLCAAPGLRLLASMNGMKIKVFVPEKPGLWGKIKFMHKRQLEDNASDAWRSVGVAHFSLRKPLNTQSPLAFGFLLAEPKANRKCGKEL